MIHYIEAPRRWAFLLSLSLPICNFGWASTTAATPASTGLRGVSTSANEQSTDEKSATRPMAPAIPDRDGYSMGFVDDLLSAQNPNPEYVALVFRARLHTLQRVGPQSQFSMTPAGRIHSIESTSIEAGSGNGREYQYVFNYSTSRPCHTVRELSERLTQQWMPIETRDPYFKSYLAILPDRRAQLSFSPNPPFKSSNCVERVYLTIQIK